MCGWQVKLCDPHVTYWSYLGTLEIRHYKALYKFLYVLLLLISLHECEQHAESRYRAVSNRELNSDKMCHHIIYMTVLHHYEVATLLL